jgi:hypothetical protein
MKINGSLKQFFPRRSLSRIGTTKVPIDIKQPPTPEVKRALKKISDPLFLQHQHCTEHKNMKADTYSSY